MAGRICKVEWSRQRLFETPFFSLASRPFQYASHLPRVMDISTPLPAETVHDTSCALMEVEMSRSTMVSPCSSTNSRSKRARENNANEHSMDVPTGETKKSAPIEDLQSQCSVFTDTIHQDSDFDLELADELVMPAPPCPSPAGYDLPCGAYEELQRQLTALEGLNKRLTREVRRQTVFRCSIDLLSFILCQRGILLLKSDPNSISDLFTSVLSCRWSLIVLKVHLSNPCLRKSFLRCAKHVRRWTNAHLLNFRWQLPSRAAFELLR